MSLEQEGAVFLDSISFLHTERNLRLLEICENGSGLHMCMYRTHIYTKRTNTTVVYYKGCDLKEQLTKKLKIKIWDSPCFVCVFLLNAAMRIVCETPTIFFKRAMTEFAFLGVGHDTFSFIKKKKVLYYAKLTLPMWVSCLSMYSPKI